MICIDHVTEYELAAFHDLSPNDPRRGVKLTRDFKTPQTPESTHILLPQLGSQSDSDQLS